MDARSAAEAAFRSITTKPVAVVAKPAAPASPLPVPGAKEMVSIRLDREVLDHFQAAGPGWQARVNAALRKAAGLA